MLSSPKIWFVAAACLVGASASYVVAQPKVQTAKPPVAAAEAEPKHDKHGGKMCAGCEGTCPMHGIAELADAKIENGPKGATITFTAKKADDLQKVQDLAKKIAAHEGCACCAKGGGCTKEGGCEQCHHDGKGHGGHAGDKGHGHAH